MNTTDIKQSVKIFMRKNKKVAYGLTVIPMLVSLVISGVGSSIPFFSLLCAPFSLLMMMLVQVTFLALMRGETFSFQKHIVDHGKETGVSYIILSIVSTLYISLWTMLLFIPGIVKTFAYSLAPFIQHDNPELSANESLKESIRMTDGKKGRLFGIYFSYYAGALLSLALTYVFGTLSLFAGFVANGTASNILVFGLLCILFAVASIVCSVVAAPRWYAALAATYEDCLNEN